MMQISNNPFEIRTLLQKEYCDGRKIGFVPTMGALHPGHGSLIAKSAAENDITVVSIFVNPTQFGPNEDLDKYPRTLEADLELCKKNGATHIFNPSEATMYPEGKENFEIMMHLRGMDKVLCGATRPGHFDGVLLVVSRLFNIVQPTRAYFGMKDFQQLSILQALGRELFFPIEIVPCDIIREADGLAMSSRNRYLDPEERKQALFLSKAIAKMKAAAQPGMKADDLLKLAFDMLPEYSRIRPDYIEIRKAKDLKIVEVLDPNDAPRIFVAAFCGATRLIDNQPLF